MKITNFRMIHVFLLGLFCWAALWTTEDAQGFVRETTSLGVPVRWHQSPIPYYIGKKGSKDVTDKSDVEAIHKAFTTWSKTKCSKITFKFQGFLEDPRSEAKAKTNVVYWVEDGKEWDLSAKTLASTLLKFNEKTGEMEDADIRFNGAFFRWSTDGKPKEGFFDVLNTATHEIGHLIGLDHTLDKEATMFGDAPAAELKKRTLDKDDIDGVCSVYPENPEDRFSFVAARSELGLFPCPKPNPKPKLSDASIPGSCESVPTTPKVSYWPALVGFALLFTWLFFMRLRKRNS